MWNNWWLREIVSMLFKLHPIALLLLGWLDLNETFLVLVVGYLAAGIVSLVKSSFVLGYDCFRIQFPLLPTIEKKIAEVVLYGFGWVIMLFYSSFLMLLFFSLLYDSVERQDYNSSIFDGKDGTVLARTLLINGSYFLLIEVLQFGRFVHNYSPEKHNVLTAYAFGFDFRHSSKWTTGRLVWLMVFFAFFLLMSTGFAFRVAIFSFFVFDLGLLVMERVQFNLPSPLHRPKN
jgi:hypothetical protein